MGRVFVVLAALLMLPLESAAADCTRNERRRSQQLVLQGIEAREGGDLLEAVQRMQRAMDVCTWGLPAFELAATYEQMGRTHDALTIYEDLLDGERYGPVEGDAERVTREGIERAGRSVAHVAVSWNDVNDYVVVRVDGEVQGETDQSSIRLRVNPGAHVIRAESEGRTAVEQRIRVAEGGTSRLELVFPERSLLGRVVIATEDDVRIDFAGQSARGEIDLELEEGEYTATLIGPRGRRTHDVTIVAGETTRYDLAEPGGRRNLRWLWIAGGVVVLGALTAATVVLTRPSDPPVFPNPT
ncbi:MAG: hypothetical protein AAF645_14715 [Myxococcota bacterium]